jgi:hypothetical protein
MEEVALYNLNIPARIVQHNASLSLQPLADCSAFLVCRVRVHSNLLQKPPSIVDLVVLRLMTVKANVLTNK